MCIVYLKVWIEFVWKQCTDFFAQNIDFDLYIFEWIFFFAFFFLIYTISSRKHINIHIESNGHCIQRLHLHKLVFFLSSRKPHLLLINHLKYRSLRYKNVTVKSIERLLFQLLRDFYLRFWAQSVSQIHEIGLRFYHFFLCSSIDTPPGPSETIIRSPPITDKVYARWRHKKTHTKKKTNIVIWCCTISTVSSVS